jgi:hypothetical protein
MWLFVSLSCFWADLTLNLTLRSKTVSRRFFMCIFIDALLADMPVFIQQIGEILKKSKVEIDVSDASALPSAEKIEFLFKLFLCATCSLYGFATLNTAMRQVRCHNLLMSTPPPKNQNTVDSMKSQGWKMLSYFNLFSPMLLSLLWVPSLFEEESIGEDGSPVKE